MNIPNLITLCRLAAVPLVIWLILDDDMMIAFWIFFAAALSDAADGIIAKHFDMETVFGAFLDPIADKALLVGVYLTLGNEGLLPTWLVILVVFRDILIEEIGDHHAGDERQQHAGQRIQDDEEHRQPGQPEKGLFFPAHVLSSGLPGLWSPRVPSMSVARRLQVTT